MSSQLAQAALSAMSLRQAASGAAVLAPAFASRAVALTRCLSTSSCQLQQKQEQAEATGAAQQQQEQTASSSSSASAGAGPSAEETAQKLYNTFRSKYDNVMGKVAGEGGTRSLLQTLQQDLRETLLPAQDIRSATRKYTGAVASDLGPGVSGGLVVVKQQRTGWEQAWDSVNEKLAGIPLLNKLSSFKVADTSAFKKGQELVEDLKDKYETSDHPMVHKVEDLKSRMFTGSEASRAMHEIRSRDPSFDMIRFLASVKLDAPVVVKAFLKHDLETLKLHCGPELLERFSGIFKHFEEQGVFEDPSILFVGDAEIVEVRMMDTDPFVIVQFHCQQLKCTRDKFGNVIDGSTNQIQRVYYFWGLQQEQSGVVTAEGKLLPPRWVIKDMMWQSLLALV